METAVADRAAYEICPSDVQERQACCTPRSSSKLLLVPKSTQQVLVIRLLNHFVLQHAKKYRSLLLQ